MNVLFAEPDKLFRLTAAALDPALADPQFLGGFFLTECADPRAFVVDWARTRVVPSNLTVTVATDAAHFARALPGASIVILEKQPITAALLGTARALKLVQVFGRDTSAVDLDACRSLGIEVRSLNRNTNLVVAEHTVMMMLAMTHRLDATRDAMTAASTLPPSGWAYNWPACPNVRSLAGRTVGLIGMGEVAQLVAAYLRPFGVKVIYTRRRRDVALEAQLDMTFVDLPALLAQSDIVSIHVPGDADNHHLLDADALARTKPGVFLVNTARGAIIDEAALVAGLRSGHIGGAALDVFAVEPLPLDHALRSAPNVILTPHLAAGSRDAAWLDIEIGPVIDAVLEVSRAVAVESAA
jgi:phosphoglycerate dehydrogenase-like enzyme